MQICIVVSCHCMYLKPTKTNLENKLTIPLISKMKMFSIQLLATVIIATVTARPIETNCTTEFHSLLEQALEVKNHCQIKGFYDCCEARTAARLVYLHSSASGVYDINNVCSGDSTSETPVQTPMQVRCDMDTDGGGWIVILRRRRNVFANVNFTRSWDEYENGFGDFNTEFWLGLRSIHCLTTRDDVDLMIDLRQSDGNGMTWIYHKFKVDGSNEKYQLHIGEAEGPPNGHDAMARHNGMSFSTYDNDNDGASKHCAQRWKGGWWYNACYASHLTGPHTDYQVWNRLLWYDGTAPASLATFDYYHNVDMKIRPKSCSQGTSDCNTGY